MSWMRQEIGEQPASGGAGTRRGGREGRRAGCGGARSGVEHAVSCRARHLGPRGHRGEVPVRDRARAAGCPGRSFVFTLYDAPVRLDRRAGARDLAVRRGGGCDRGDAPGSRARRADGLHHQPRSTRAWPRPASFPLLCHAGEERSLPATKTYTTSLALLYRLAVAMGARPELATALAAAPDAMQAALTWRSRWRTAWSGIATWRSASCWPAA